MKNGFFTSAFSALVGCEPFGWQERLYRCLLEGKIPGACDVPTGLGKTAVIPVWLIALVTAHSRLPRRLIYIVDRRTVVDQATDVAERLRERISAAGDEEQILGRIRKGLAEARRKDTGVQSPRSMV